MDKERLIDQERYPFLAEYASLVKKMERELVGREREIQAVLAGLARPELCNVLLLAEPGCGKTSVVQGTMVRDSGRIYLEVDLARMIANLHNENEMAAKLKVLFDEAVAYQKQEEKELVLFIDEFHQIVELSKAAVEALKPLLADSGTRGIKVIAATTYKEFQDYIAPNQPLVERLNRINLSEPDMHTTVMILKGFAERYGVLNQFYGDHLFELIYEYTNRYIPANAQPRKSILILDAMIGWHKSYGRVLNRKLLADVIYASEGVNVSFNVDGTTIKENLGKRVLAQGAAVNAIENRLQVSVADLQDHSRPMGSLLFTGGTGVGKTEMSKALAELLFNNERALIRMDMSEFSQPSSVERFRDVLTTQIWEHPYSIVLMDEIEKACGDVTRILLQVLDDGRLINRHNREVSFVNCYIIMTTNLASEIYSTISQYAEDDTGNGREMTKYMALIRRAISEGSAGKFPPELLGRIDAIVPFQPLSINTRMDIVKNKLRKLAEDVQQKHGVELVFAKKVPDYLIYENLDTKSDSGGARQVIQRMNTEVVSTVARFINQNPDVIKIGVTVEGEMAYQNKGMLESNAKIVVKAIK